MKSSPVLRQLLRNPTRNRFSLQRVGPLKRTKSSTPYRNGLPPYRSITTYSTPTDRLREAIRTARKDNPVLLPVLFVAALGAMSLLTLMAYDEYTRVAPEYAAFPTAVEQRLRLALHYTHVSPDPDAATRYFEEAIKAASASEMDPFGKEFMGIRIRLAEMLEQFGRTKGAIEVLVDITKDCEAKLAELDRTTSQTEAGQFLTESELKDAALRKGLLRGIVQAKVKTSSLYESDYVQDIGMAKQTLSDAVGLLVKETRDPQANGFSDENGAGFSMGEIASILSQMGDLYATSGEEANAVQVYMLTLEPLRRACNGTRSCKEVQVLSNIASTMDLALKKPAPVINGRPATKSSLTAARKAALKWADQAIATADAVTPQDRDEICELGLISAQMTRADLLFDIGDRATAQETFRGLLPTLRQKGLKTLVDVAEQGLKRGSG